MLKRKDMYNKLIESTHKKVFIFPNNALQLHDIFLYLTVWYFAETFISTWKKKKKESKEKKRKRKKGINRTETLILTIIIRIYMLKTNRYSLTKNEEKWLLRKEWKVRTDCERFSNNSQFDNKTDSMIFQTTTNEKRFIWICIYLDALIRSFGM